MDEKIHAGIAQLGEQLSCKQQVPGSNPGAGTTSAPVAQRIEQPPPKRWVAGSNPAGWDIFGILRREWVGVFPCSSIGRTSGC